MKKITKISLLFIAFTVFLASCSMEKRHYNRGYYVKWKNSNKHSGMQPLESAAINTTPDKKNITEETPVIKEESVFVSPTLNETPQITSNSSAGTKKVVKTEKSGVKATIINTLVENNEDVIINHEQSTIKQTEVKSAKSAAKRGGPSKGLLIVLCFLIPWLAVGLATDWDVMPIIYNLLWSLTCIGGIIHAIIVVNREM